MPEPAKVVPAFNVESIEKSPDRYVKVKVARKVEFESYEFNQEIPRDGAAGVRPDPGEGALLLGFLEWVTTWTGWSSSASTTGSSGSSGTCASAATELKLALANAGQLFKRIHAEMEEEGIITSARILEHRTRSFPG